MHEISYYENEVTAEELVYLQDLVGFGKADPEQADKALKNSLFSVSVKVDGEAVGMGRIVGDGARIFYLQDIFVAPEYQGMGIGSGIVTRLMNYIKQNAIGNATSVGLMAAKGKEIFYTKLGFRLRPNEKEGNGMMYTLQL